MYDTAERRQSRARELEAKGIDQKVIATRMRADVSQGRPATEAVRGSSRAPKARATRAPESQLQLA
jgi:hypothetical protein